MKQFTFAGVSRRNGTLDLRLANDAKRAAMLVKLGHADVKLVELKRPMGRAEAAQALIAMNFAMGVKEVQDVLEVAAELVAKPAAAKAKKAAKPAAKAAKTVKVKADKKVRVKATKAVVAEDAEPVMTDAELAAYIEANMKEVTPKMKAEFRTVRAAAFDRG